MCVLILLSLIGQSSSINPPPELEAMMDYEAAMFNTAVIEWSLDPSDYHRTLTVQRYTSQYGGGDCLFVEHPADDPKIIRERMGQPWAFSEYRKLYQSNGDRWSYVEGAAHGNVVDAVSAPTSGFIDYRAASWLPLSWASPRGAGQVDPHTLFHDRVSAEVVSYEARPTRGGTTMVSANLRDRTRLTWWLDTESSAPLAFERAAPLPEGGESIQRTEVQYGEIDGRRFPLRIESSIDGVRSGLITAQHVELDRSYQTAQLDVGDALRMLPGTNILRSTADSWSSPRIFDGHTDLEIADASAKGKAGLLNTTEFERRMANWEQDPKRAYPKSPSDFESNATVRRSPGLWEDYTRSFIKVYALEEKQTDKAWEHLRTCQKKASDYLKRRDPEFVRIRTRSAEALSMRDSEQSTAEEKQKADQALLELRDEKEKIDAGIDEFFSHDLKPGLFKLLSKQQRAEGEERLKAMKVDPKREPD